MKSWHCNGEYWYCRDFSILKRIRIWLIWVGGWEKANHKGWQFFRRNAKGKMRLRSLGPLSFFGKRFTYYNWGFWEFKLKRAKRWLVWSETGIYLSPDGTPGEHADFYFRKPKGPLAWSSLPKHIAGEE